MNSWILACLAASIMSSIGTWRELSPYAIFSSIEPSNKIGSWDTIPIWDLNQWRSAFFTSKLLTLTSPPSTS